MAGRSPKRRKAPRKKKHPGGRPRAADRDAVKGEDGCRRSVRLLRLEDDLLVEAAAKSGETVSEIMSRGSIAEAKRILEID